MLDQVGNQNVGFLMTRLNYSTTFTVQHDLTGVKDKGMFKKQDRGRFKKHSHIHVVTKQTLKHLNDALRIFVIHLSSISMKYVMYIPLSILHGNWGTLVFKYIVYIQLIDYKKDCRGWSTYPNTY